MASRACPTIVLSALCAYQCYAPLPPVRAIVGQGGDLTNLNINCPSIRDIPYNQIPLQKVGDYWGFDTHSVTVQYTETIAVFKMSSAVIKCPTIGAASFGQSPYIARHLPVRGVVGHNIDRYIKDSHRTSVMSISCFVANTKNFSYPWSPYIFEYMMTANHTLFEKEGVFGFHVFAISNNW